MVTHLSVTPVAAGVLLAYPPRFEQEKQVCYILLYRMLLAITSPSSCLTWDPKNGSVRPVVPLKKQFVYFISQVGWDISIYIVAVDWLVGL